MIHVFLLSWLLFYSSVSVGQSPDLGSPVYVTQSSTLLIRFYPGAKTGKVFLVGKKAADINLTKDAKLVSVTLLNQGKTEELKLSQDGSGYLLESATTFPERYELHLKAETRGQLQQMKLQINGSP